MRVIKPLLTNLAGVSFFVAVLLVSAGRLDYWQGWLYAAVSLLLGLSIRVVLRNDPDLVKERAKPGPGAQGWDKRLLGIGLLLTLCMLVVAGLDAGRYGWRPHLAWTWSMVGVALNLAGMMLLLAAMRENRFFSAVVRVQRDRGQSVCRTGPYGVIRHPGNAGMIVGTMGLPLLFTSAWSAIPALLSVALLVVRTHLEDVLMHDELEGYRDYARTTRFRLIPGVW